MPKICCTPCGSRLVPVAGKAQGVLEHDDPLLKHAVIQWRMDCEIGLVGGRVTGHSTGVECGHLCSGAFPACGQEHAGLDGPLRSEH